MICCCVPSQNGDENAPAQKRHKLRRSVGTRLHIDAAIHASKVVLHYRLNLVKAAKHVALHEREAGDRGAGEGVAAALSKVQPVREGPEVCSSLSLSPSSSSPQSFSVPVLLEGEVGVGEGALSGIGIVANPGGARTMDVRFAEEGYDIFPCFAALVVAGVSVALVTG